MSKKTCFKCGLELAISSFYRHRQMGDGHLGKCKDCCKKDVAENRRKNVDYYREYDRGRNGNDNRQEAKRKQYHTIRAKYGEWWNRAHNAVHRALRAGTLVRPDHCSRCLTDCAPQAHHDDYQKPLDVMWLCPICHAERHLELGRLGKHSPRKPAPGGVGEGKN